MRHIPLDRDDIVEAVARHLARDFMVHATAAPEYAERAVAQFERDVRLAVAAKAVCGRCGHRLQVA